MDIEGRAIILATQKFSENDALVTLFTREHGLLKGIAKRALTSANRGIYQVGNWVDALWHARLEEHLGSITCNLYAASGSMAMSDRGKCYALQSMCALVMLAFEQRDAHPKLFRAIDQLMEAVQYDLPWRADYVRFELTLLQEAGFGLGLHECAATGDSDHLMYISPKSGCAVSAQAGEPYKDKLFAFPDLLREEMHSQASDADIQHGLAITGHFIRKWLLPVIDKNMPIAREQLERMKP